MERWNNDKDNEKLHFCSLNLFFFPTLLLMFI